MTGLCARHIPHCICSICYKDVKKKVDFSSNRIRKEKPHRTSDWSLHSFLSQLPHRRQMFPMLPLFISHPVWGSAGPSIFCSYLKTTLATVSERQKTTPFSKKNGGDTLNVVQRGRLGGIHCPPSARKFEQIILKGRKTLCGGVGVGWCGFFV